MARNGRSSEDARVGRPHLQTNAHRARAYSQSQSRRSSVVSPSATVQLSWLFRSNIPRRRGMLMPSEGQKRNFFGMGEIISVLANPSETLRSLTESKRMLEETRRELAEARERAQLGPTHTFSPLPGFFDRPAELGIIERALEGTPSFTVLFGASSVGKTALLRQVLTRPVYHVLHFDLRIAGFADLASLYMSMSQQMEAFFMGIAQDPEMPGYEEFEKQAWGFKHDRLNVERRISTTTVDGPGAAALGEIKTSDIARLMELFQSSLLKYWNFHPSKSSQDTSGQKNGSRTTTPESSQGINNVPRARRWTFFGRKKNPSRKPSEELLRRPNNVEKENGNAEGGKPPVKKMPVFFIDEAHKLPALIRSTAAMKCLLDAMLVLTKQDRLCHVIHATSDPFYQTWLRQLNVMQHCKIITIGDYSKSETRRYFRERVLPSVPEQLRTALHFEKLYHAFGGKLAHWQDYITDYVNSGGKLDIKQGSHFLQAHALLNLHIIHSSQAPPPGSEDDGEAAANRHSHQNGPQPALHQHAAGPPTPITLGPGFRIYSPLAASADPHASPPAFASPTVGSDTAAEFASIQLLRVMNRFAQPGTRALSYFMLCRELGARAVDGMIRGRILDLRWTDPVSKEGSDPRIMSMRVRESMHAQRAAASSGTAVNEPGSMFDPEEEMIAISDDEMFRESRRAAELQAAEEEDEIVGPKLVPITPIMRFAMREVVQEYYEDDDRTVSEYASLSGVEEY